MTPAATPTVFVVDDDASVRAAIQGMPKSVGRYENSHTKV
jgi:FixJ family two-component response regulator